MVAPAYFEENEEHSRPTDVPHTVRGIAQLVWGLSVTILLVPSLFVWIIRGVAFAAQCTPGPALCNGMALGGGLRDALELSWFLPSNITVMLTIAFVATIAGMFARRPLLAASGLLLLPLATLMLPMTAVYVSQYDRCRVGADAFPDCTLWGAPMGNSFHNAANVPDIILGFAPYSFALATMLAVLGWFLARPRGRHGASGDPFSDQGH